jgi:hypothetical protein
MGSGLTTHTLLADASIEVVDTIEIEPAMVAGARGFGERISRAFDDPRSRIHTGDAKTFFSLNNKQYDIIVAEPSNPWVSGVSSLFSSEFYNMIRNYLPDDGLFVQWLQLYEFNDELVFSVLKALSAHFDDYVIYNTDNVDIIIIAKKHGKLSRPEFSRILNGQMAEDLKRINIRSDNDFLVRKTARKDMIEALFPYYDVPANSDYFPYLDLNAGKARFKHNFAELMYTWSTAPVPVLELLHGDPLQFSETQHDSSFRRLEAIAIARTIYNELVTRDSTFEDTPIPGELYLAVQTVDLMRAQCSIVGNENKWEFAWHHVAAATLAYLDAGEASELVSSVYAPDCRAGVEAATENWMNFYAGIAARDTVRMSKAGVNLLENEDIVHPAQLQYVVAATMLGYVKLGQHGDATKVWQRYAVPANLRAEPYTNLLLQIARTHGS